MIIIKIFMIISSAQGASSVSPPRDHNQPCRAQRGISSQQQLWSFSKLSKLRWHAPLLTQAGCLPINIAIPGSATSSPSSSPLPSPGEHNHQQHHKHHHRAQAQTLSSFARFSSQTTVLKPRKHSLTNLCCLMMFFPRNVWGGARYSLLSLRLTNRGDFNA